MRYISPRWRHEKSSSKLHRYQRRMNKHWDIAKSRRYLIPHLQCGFYLFYNNIREANAYTHTYAYYIEPRALITLERALLSSSSRSLVSLVLATVDSAYYSRPQCGAEGIFLTFIQILYLIIIRPRVQRATALVAVTISALRRRRASLPHPLPHRLVLRVRSRILFAREFLSAPWITFLPHFLFAIFFSPREHPLAARCRVVLFVISEYNYRSR